MTVIRIIQPAYGGPSDLDGMYLKTYDPDARNGRGLVTGTHDRDKAMHFPDAAAALACLRQVPRLLPVRPDGKPNRPLTAFHIEIENSP